MKSPQESTTVRNELNVGGRKAIHWKLQNNENTNNSKKDCADEIIIALMSTLPMGNNGNTDTCKSLVSLFMKYNR